jgi:pyruvate/2-oxoglutarate dehydrogenase complex dihydrolipoamide acyltransferase (E2) component
VNALGNLTFSDVALDAKPENGTAHATVTADTFDNLTYTLRMGKLKNGEDYLVGVSVSGEPPRDRPPEKDEKAEQKAQRDKDFAENRKRLESRLAREKALAQWTYVVEAKQITPLLKTREQMVAQRKQEGDNGQPPPAASKGKGKR